MRGRSHPGAQRAPGPTPGCVVLSLLLGARRKRLAAALAALTLRIQLRTALRAAQRFELLNKGTMRAGSHGNSINQAIGRKVSREVAGPPFQPRPPSEVRPARDEVAKHNSLSKPCLPWSLRAIRPARPPAPSAVMRGVFTTSLRPNRYDESAGFMVIHRLRNVA